MKRNIVLICLDSVRSDTFDQHTLKIGERSDSSVECRAASSWSPSSHGSLLTGQLPSVHGVNSTEFDYAVVDFEETFLSKLDEFETIGVSANTHASSVFNFDRFFDRFVDIGGGSLFASGINVKAESRSIEADRVSFLRSLLWRCLKHPLPLQSMGNVFATKAESFFDGKPVPGFLDNGASSVIHRTLKQVSDATEPVFVFTNFMEAHEPYRVKRFYDEIDVADSWSSNEIDKWGINTGNITAPEYIERYRTVYEQSVRYLDRVVADLIDELHLRTDRETTIIITADHGQNLGYDYEDGLIGHKASLSEGLLNVPCKIVNPPDSLDVDLERLHSHLDIGRLITSIAHETQFEPAISEECLPAEVLGIGTERDNVPEDERAYWDRTIRCIYEGNTKTQWDSLGNTVRYEISTDRASWQRRLGEDISLPGCASEVFERPISEVGQDAPRHGDDVNETVRDQMRELGYL